MRQHNICPRSAFLAVAVVALSTVLGGCGPLPGETAMTKAQREAPYPRLVPLAGIEAQAAALRGEGPGAGGPGAGGTTLSAGMQGTGATGPVGPETARALDARGAALRARAARLTAPRG